jgi:hypothetical protein
MKRLWDDSPAFTSFWGSALLVQCEDEIEIIDS